MDDVREPWLLTWRMLFSGAEVTSLAIHGPAEPQPHVLVGKEPRAAAAH
jgi:hypothetical protein